MASALQDRTSRTGHLASFQALLSAVRTAGGPVVKGLACPLNEGLDRGNGPDFPPP